MARTRRTRTVLAAAAVAALVGVTGGAPAAADPSPQVLSYRFGSSDVGFAEGGIRESMVDRFDAMDAYVGAKKPIVRVDLNWAHIEPQSCPGVCEDGLNWGQIDTVVQAANARGLRVLVVLAYSPAWANGGHETGGWFPTSDADWVDIVKATVRHLGANVQAYEIWNEPNLKRFGDYGTARDEKQRTEQRKKRYWELVRLAYPHVRAGCPSCTVLAGGSAAPPSPATAEEYADNPHTPSSWLRAGYTTYQAKGFFDAVAHHPYPPANSGLGPAHAECDYHFYNQFGPPFHTDRTTGKKCGGELAAVREVMLAHQDGAKKIWGTEWGYPTAGHDEVLSPAQIRTYMVDGVYMWRALDYTGPLFLYSYRDVAADENPLCAAEPGNAECNFGVVTAPRDGVPSVAKEPLFSDLAVALRGEFPRKLPAGAALSPGSALRSDDGRFYLWLQHDGNLVLYRATTTPVEVLWKQVNRQGTRLVMQTDGNLVLLDATRQPVWSSGSYQGPDRTTYLLLQNDGNLVIRRDSDDAPVWDTGTWGH